MNPALLVMNPRRIDECVDSIERLPISQFWLTGYTEIELEPVIRQLVAERSEFTHWLICSDDGVIPDTALLPVLQGLRDGYPVVTGYSNLDSVDMRVNLTRKPWRENNESRMEEYDLYHLSEVLGWKGPLVRSWFAGFALTGMSRDLWLQYPFTAAGYPTDWHLAQRLQKDGVPIVAPKGALMWHVKERINTPDQEQRKRLLVGHVPACVTFKEAPA